MTPLQSLEALDLQATTLLELPAGIEQSLDLHVQQVLSRPELKAADLLLDGQSLLTRVGQRLAGEQPFTAPAAGQVARERISLPAGFAQAIERFCQQARQTYHRRFVDYWLERDSRGLTRRSRLVVLRREQLDAEIRLRLFDQTLEQAEAELLRICIERGQPWQRQHLPSDARPQVYRPLLDGSDPSWRLYLPGSLVLVERGPEGRMVEPGEPVGKALLCSLAHGIEAFASLADLHLELCERLEDPLQSRPLVELLVDPQAQRRACQAERLRYDWYTDDFVHAQVDAVRNAHRHRLALAWQQAWNSGLQADIPAFDAALQAQLQLDQVFSSKGALATRYALLLEKHLPAWLRNASQQALSHIMQTLQELVVAIEQAAAPGIPTLEEFHQRNRLLDWTRQRLQARLLHATGLELDVRQLRLSVTMARQVGPVFNPLMPSSYIPIANRPQVGDTIELVPVTYKLEELALLNIAWFDTDYWLTARLHRADGRPAPAGLDAALVKRLIRELNAGNSYPAFLRWHLLESANGKWRQWAHGRINRARMRSEAAKALHAGHYLETWPGQGYAWTRSVLDYPDNAHRPLVEGRRIVVSQLLVDGHTLQGVLLVSSLDSSPYFLLYAANAPDSRPWRHYRNPRHLLRALRESVELRRYVKERLPLLPEQQVERLLTRGRLAAHLQRPLIAGNLFDACYLAQVQALLEKVDASSNTSLELLGETALQTFWILLDLVSVWLPQRTLAALAFGRAAVATLDSLEELQEDDRLGALSQAIEALAHAADGVGTIAGSAITRKAIRHMPPNPPGSLPNHYQVAPEVGKLRYRLGGLHGEGVYEMPSPYQGLSHYYIKDNAERFYQVRFDGRRWRAVDPQQPDAYLQVPIKRRADGNWIVDSPVLWYDGLPDLAQLLDDCALTEPASGTPSADGNGLYRYANQLYLQAGKRRVGLRKHLLANHYHLLIPAQRPDATVAWAVLRWQEREWRIRVRQAGRSSDWLALPEDYQPNLGNS